MGKGSLDDYIMEFEELQPTQVTERPRLRLLVCDFLWRDRSVHIFDGNLDVLVEPVDET